MLQTMKLQRVAIKSKIYKNGTMQDIENWVEI